MSLITTKELMNSLQEIQKEEEKENSSNPNTIQPTSNKTWKTVNGKVIGPPLVSYETQRRCTATDVFFLEYYYDLLTYLYKRRCRLERFKEIADKEKWKDGEREMEWKRYCEKETIFLRRRRTRLRLSHFQLLTQVGQGGYGQVFLCKKKDTGELCALKKMSKKAIYSQNEIAHVLTERDVLRAGNSPWLVKLLYSFQDKGHVYLAMEYVPGGDVRTLLNTSGILRESCGKFYIAEMFLAVVALHNLGYIHRDLKPENFLIDVNGHIKLADFGLSKGALSPECISYLKDRLEEAKDKKVIQRSSVDRRNIHRSLRLSDRQMAYSLVGSPDYMAPEILANKGYDFLVDYWSVGCIFFEFLAGYAPFTAPSTDELWVNVLNWKEVFQRPHYDGDDVEFNLSDESWDLICKLITDKERRISSIKEIQSHPFFVNINWSTLRECKRPPFVPELKSPMDTTYFDDFTNPECLAMYKDILAAKKDEDEEDESKLPPRSAFIGFTFRHSNWQDKTISQEE